MIPKMLIDNIKTIHAEKGEQWLRCLPDLLRRYEKLWSLKLGECFADASFNYVAPALLENGTEVVVKCGLPGSAIEAEASALKHFNGVGAVQVLQFELKEGIVLLEKIHPGTLLEACSDEDQATAYAVELIQKLHRPLKSMKLFVTLNDWFQGLEALTRYFNGNAGPFPARLVDKAKSISRDWLSSMGEPILLHGDLHYANILLSDQAGWVAIDPKGVIGEREFEIPFPRLNDSDDAQLLRNRLDCFIENSGFDRQRIIGWLFSKAILAAWWTFEDSGQTGKKFIHCAEVLEPLLNPKIQKSPEKYNSIIEHNQRSYDQIADIWFKEREWYIEKDSIDQAIKNIKPGGKILDVGCGSGKPIAEYLLKHNFDVYGVDISAGQIQHALQIIPKEKLWIGDIRFLPISETFDAIFCWFTLFHIHADEQAMVLKKFYELLNPKGIISLTMADTTSAPQGEFDKVDSQTMLSTMFGETFYHSGHTRKINLELMVNAGFQIISEYCDQPGNQVILAQKIDVP